MEHEVYVPFPVGPVRAALAEAARVARCVPGLQLDAPEGSGEAAGGESGAGGTVAGRLRLRIGGSTITYRGTLTLAARDDGFRVTGTGDEARGSGSARLTLTVVPRPADGSGEAGDGGGTVLACAGSVRGEGRLAETEARHRTAAARRLLERFGEALAESLAAEPPADDNERAIPGIPAPEEPAAETTASPEPASEAAVSEAPVSEKPASEERPAPEESPAGRDGSGFGAEVPSPSPGPLDEDAYDSDEPVPAEAAHARRTMIGRSAEEVDHAPPRGRYAPVPAPETVSTTAALRWAAPAAALAVASAVLVGRVLRRRRS
ncbi:hypothetical protein V1J52_17155 [Streptomyces sp. TRM 70351]|uniref:hypothetical protein n=1 Tax=Streptomyces sp. TRM 70351 TaxID=3116552 RepID=UPI002E7BA33F|nr:hypothetical protein [Streptomyces sp. TRM 70351]MEE1929888.1 hypothetical protein [Streptomyces sp. TRM 70351]